MLQGGAASNATAPAAGEGAAGEEEEEAGTPVEFDNIIDLAGGNVKQDFVFTASVSQNISLSIFSLPLLTIPGFRNSRT